MIIENKRNALVILPGGQRLRPGENDVLDAEWAKQEDHHWIEYAVENDIIEVRGEGEATSILDSIHKMSVAKAKTKVAKESNIARLQGWLEASKKPQLKGAINKRIAELGATAARPPEDTELIFGGDS